MTIFFKLPPNSGDLPITDKFFKTRRCLLFRAFTTLTCCRLTLIYCPYLALCLPLYQWFWNLYCTNNNLLAKYIVLSNIISVASDNILRICIQEPLLISKKFIVLLHTLSAYNSLLVRYKVYSSDPRECLCTSWRYAEAYENFSIDPAPFRKNPIKIKIR